MSDPTDEIAAAATRHGLTEAGAQALFAALVRGGGSLAQFSHADVGGMGQWSNGMLQIGDMFNDGLKAKVSAFCFEMADVARRRSQAAPAPAASQRQSQTGERPTMASKPPSPWSVLPTDWWPAGLGTPASTGSQNGMRYACFPEQRRLAVDRNGRVTLYDTGHNRLSGFSQAQSATTTLAFSGQDGPVSLDSLRIVSEGEDLAQRHQ